MNASGTVSRCQLAEVSVARSANRLKVCVCLRPQIASFFFFRVSFVCEIGAGSCLRVCVDVCWWQGGGPWDDPPTCPDCWIIKGYSDTHRVTAWKEQARGREGREGVGVGGVRGRHGWLCGRYGTHYFSPASLCRCKMSSALLVVCLLPLKSISLCLSRPVALFELILLLPTPASFPPYLFHPPTTTALYSFCWIPLCIVDTSLPLLRFISFTPFPRFFPI